MKEVILLIISALIVILTFLKSQGDEYKRFAYSESELSSKQLSELQYSHKAYTDQLGKNIR